MIVDGYFRLKWFFYERNELSRENLPTLIKYLLDQFQKCIFIHIRYEFVVTEIFDHNFTSFHFLAGTC